MNPLIKEETSLDKQLHNLQDFAKSYKNIVKSRTCFSSAAVSKEIDKNLKNLLNKTIENLEITLSSQKEQLTDQQYRKLAVVFFDKLSSMSEKVFDRKSIKEDSFLEKALADSYKMRSHQSKGINELKNEVKELQERRKNGERLPPSELEATLVEQEAKLAIALGVKAKSGAGAMSNSYFLHDVRGKKIAIFKPDIEGSRGRKNPKLRARINTWFAKNIFKFLSLRQMRQRISETFTFKASLLLNSPIVPPSKISTFTNGELGQDHRLKQKRGSLQILVSAGTEGKMMEAKDVLKVAEAPTALQAFISVFIRWVQSLFITSSLLEQLKKTPLLIHGQVEKSTLDTIPKSLFAQMAFLDFATGQIDRHYGNFMLNIKDPQQPGANIGVSVDRLGLASEKGSYLVLIDNGAAAGRNHPKAIEARNMYLFSELPIFEGPFYKNIPKGTFPEDWDKALLKTFFDLTIAEDIHDLDSKDIVQDALKNICNKLDFTISDRKNFSAKCKEIIFNELNEQSIPTEDVKTLKLRLKKMFNQLYTMNQRLNVLKVFLDPPKSNENEYTLRLLGSIKTEEDYKIFWDMVKEHNC